jgi:transcriptional regulator with XRE-family HTH domain
VDALRFGRAFRVVRQRARLRQADVAVRAETSRSTVSRIERGRVGRIQFATLRRVGAALEADVELTFRWRGEAVDRLLDEAHADLVDVAAGLLRRHEWEIAIETTFSIDAERGSIDILGWHAAERAVLVGEVKSVVPDAQATISALDRKTRLAARIARERGWEPVTVGRVLLVGEGTTARRRIARHAAMFETAFPHRGREMLRWLRRPVGPVSGLLFLPLQTGPSPNSRAVGLGQRRAGPGA